MKMQSFLTGLMNEDLVEDHLYSQSFMLGSILDVHGLFQQGNAKLHRTPVTERGSRKTRLST